MTLTSNRDAAYLIRLTAVQPGTILPRLKGGYGLESN